MLCALIVKTPFLGQFCCDEGSWTITIVLDLVVGVHGDPPGHSRMCTMDRWPMNDVCEDVIGRHTGGDNEFE
jgi:hypothetical protein